MPFIRRHTRILLVAVSCAAAGAAAGAIATAGAATNTSSHPAAAHRLARRALLRRVAARAVHGSVVVRTRAGFQTITFDRGRVDGVSGRQLTLTEGTPKASYKTVTLTIPTSARVRDDRHRATLSQLTAGQRVIVIVAPRQTFVIAHTPRSRAG